MQLKSMKMTNKLIIAAAGSGKTTLLVEKALEQEGNVLITTYTEANEAEIRRKLIKERQCIPSNITVQTWFSFLLQHGVRPYQGAMDEGLYSKKIGFYLCNERSGLRSKNTQGQPIYWGEADFNKHYFTKDFKIYSDKISKFILNCDKKSNNEVINRIARIFPHIFIDEVQDLAGYDLELLKLLFKSSSNILLVGDPRQVTYLTHHETKYKKYKDGLIKEFILNECKKEFNKENIDEDSLNCSYRNNKQICEFSSRLYPKLKPVISNQTKTTGHDGVYLVKKNDVAGYCKKYKPQILRYQKSKFPELNYGNSKGMGFDRVLIYPTKEMEKYLKTGNISNIKSIEKFYVAVTRARYSVSFVCDYIDDVNYIEGLRKYKKLKIFRR